MWDTVRLKELPPQIGAILLRGLHDAHYEKASLDFEQWSNDRAARSWEDLLTHGVEPAILDEGFEVVWKHLGKGPKKSFCKSLPGAFVLEALPPCPPPLQDSGLA